MLLLLLLPLPLSLGFQIASGPDAGDTVRVEIDTCHREGWYQVDAVQMRGSLGVPLRVRWSEPTHVSVRGMVSVSHNSGSLTPRYTFLIAFCPFFMYWAWSRGTRSASIPRQQHRPSGPAGKKRAERHRPAGIPGHAGVLRPGGVRPDGHVLLWLLRTGLGCHVAALLFITSHSLKGRRCLEMA